MPNRRKFIRETVLGSMATLTVLNACNSTEGTQAATGKPLVLSTWDFGRMANEGAWQILEQKGSALDAVEAGVRITEADENNQSVGIGGLPDRDGRVTLDACIMDHAYNCGAVLCLEHIKHPVSVARRVMEKTPHIFLSGQGALQFALKEGFEKENLLTIKSKIQYEEWLKTAEYQPEINIENRLYEKDTTTLPGGELNHDTIGMLARDADGNLSGACTTSGMAFKLSGRVGDSPIIGAGLYVDNKVGAATATGVGEEVIRIVGAFLVVELMRQGNSPEKACRLAVERIVERGKERASGIQVGFIAMNNAGEYGAFALQPGFSYAVRTATEDKVIKAAAYFS